VILLPINRNNLIEVTNRVLELNTLDLCSLSEYDIKVCIQNSFYLPYHIYPQKAGSIIYRALISDDKMPFDFTQRISYNPKPSEKNGRSHLTGETVFYSSSALDTAVIEVCQDSIRTTKQTEYYITVGHWRINQDLEVDVKCHSKVAQEAGTDLKVAAESIDKIMRKGKTEEEYKIFLLESEFYSDQFAKSQIDCQNDYLFSAVYSSQVLNHNTERCDGIWYPSVAYKYRGFNAAYKPSLFDMKIINLVKVSFAKVLFNDIKSYPTISVLAETTNIIDEKIYWD
jgi:hypothetical protein